MAAQPADPQADRNSLMPPALLEVTKDFRFEAAHTLQRDIGAEGSRRIHGHSYRARVAVRGRPDPATGMVIDLEKLEQAFAAIRARQTGRASGRERVCQ